MSDPKNAQEDDLDASFDDNNQDLETPAEATAEKAEPAPAAKPAPSDRPASDSRFFAIRTTGGQERMVADMLYTKVTSKKIGIRSVMVLDNFKGYIIV
jgi:transcriptional antiterminator NusG